MVIKERGQKQLIKTVGSAVLLGAAIFPSISCGDNQGPLPGFIQESPKASDQIIKAARDTGEDIPENLPKLDNLSVFSSVNFPYQMLYPTDWKAISTQTNGKKIDIFSDKENKNLITVFSEPVEKFVTTDSYATNLLNQIKTDENGAAMVEEDIVAKEKAMREGSESQSCS